MASPTNGADRSRTWQFSKTKMCKFYLVGMCTKGSQCPFAHQKTELRELPDLTCTKLCKTLIQTGLCEDSRCAYAHSKDELRATSTFYKTKLCRFSQMGHCALGLKCNFAHSDEEIRPLDTTKLPEPPVEITPEPKKTSRPKEILQKENRMARPQLQQQTALQQQQRHLEQQQQQLQQQQLQQQIQMQQQQLHQQHHQLMEQQQQNKMLTLALQQQLALSTNSLLPGGLLGLSPLQNSPAVSGPSDSDSKPREAHGKRRGGRRGKACRVPAKSESDEQRDDGVPAPGAPPGIPPLGLEGTMWIPGQVRSGPRVPGPLDRDERGDLRAAPAYVTSMGAALSSMGSAVVNKTFLENELGPIGKMRPIRSAAGRLDRLAGSGGSDSEDEELDKEGLYDLSQAAGLVSHPHFAPPLAAFEQLKDSQRAGSAGATSAGSTQACPSQASTSLNAANGLWDSQLYPAAGYPDAREDIWQVKNTFLTLSPRAKPIRSVRTADGALCELGSLLDDEA
ncbi:unnamed protein product [Durusdinium trenchii]|uniref:C3H1-type domain-containing protein n=1 Tax=Durusdinium trenchii TaxID=1381693 RepID=A0ABP0HWM7_9DINO